MVFGEKIGRQLEFRRIMKARNIEVKEIHQIKTPVVNFRAEIYAKLNNWQIIGKLNNWHGSFNVKN